jgi:hypothetical protein
MRVTDLQIRKVIMDYEKSGKIEMAALKAGMTRKTASKYLHKEGPLEPKGNRDWRTRENPFETHWPQVEARLQEAPELEAKALFEWLCERYPGRYTTGQLRTFQRQLKRWRALHGPDKEVYFAQIHPPGVRLSTDFTWMNHLGITIRGDPFAHLLCHSVLSYSNWEWAMICQRESFLALRQGLQATLLRLGHVPREHWTDHSTAATHEVAAEEKTGRGFNRSYLDLMNHFGMTPHTIQVKKPHENGDVESQNSHLKRRLDQHLLLRGHRDFENVEEYRLFLENVLDKANDPRRERLAEELAVMPPLTAALLPEYVEERARVSRYSVIHNEWRTYSVPSRLIGEEVVVRRYEDRLEIYYAGQHQMSCPRLSAVGDHAVNYRHIIEWLVRKPGAFREYRFREELFPTPVFRRAYDRLLASCPERTADVEYLRLLRQAARTMEGQVEKVLLELEEKNLVPRWTTLMEWWPAPEWKPPVLAPRKADLQRYDELFQGIEVTR